MGTEVNIRTDGDASVGLGHLMRCITLAKILKDDFSITFFCKDLPDSIKEDLTSSGIAFHLIKHEDDYFNRLNPDAIAILDGYDFSSGYQEKIKNIGSKLVFIDDLHDKKFVADLIINYSPGINSGDYTAKPYTKFALGLEYILLRPLFLDQSNKTRKITGVENVIICFGGSDIFNLTESVLSIVVKFSQLKKIIVVGGMYFHMCDSFLKMLNSDSRIDFRKNINEEQMLSAMLEAELAIVPTSTTLYEAMVCKCLILGCWYAQNQKKLHDYLTEKNLIYSFGDCSGGVNLDRFEKSFTNIMHETLKQEVKSDLKIFSNVHENYINLFKELAKASK